MAGKIKGITIEIGGNTTKLQKALSDTNRNIKETQTELRQVERLLKLDPKNTELLAQKQKLLGDAVGDTKNKLDTLKEAERQVQQQFERGEDVEEQYRAIQREVIQTEQDLKKLEKQVEDVNTKWQKGANALGEFGDKSEAAGKKLLPVTAAIGGAGIAATVMASNFDDAIAKVSTIADETEVPIETLKKSIMDLSNQTGISAAEIANDVYDAISAGQSTGDAVAFVAQSSKLAKAGFAESAQSLDLLTTIMNAYGLEADEVNKVSDMLIQTQNKGKVTVGELSTAMGKIIPTAKANGVELDQVSAGYAILTSNGIKAAEATTYMNGMFNELGKTGSKTDIALRELSGKSFKQLMDEGASVSDVLGMLSENAEKNGLSLADMFGSAEAAKAALVLLGDDAETFNNSVKDMNDSIGATDTAFEKLQTDGEKSRITFNKIKNSVIQLGDVVLPIVGKVAEVVGMLTDYLLNMDESTRTVVVAVLAMVAALGPALIIIGKIATGISSIMTLMAPLVAGVTGASGAAGGLGAVLTALTGPIGLVVAAVAGLIAIVVTMWNTNEEFRDNVKELWEQIKEIFNLALTFITEFIQKELERIREFWDKNSEQLKAIVQATWELITGLIEAALSIISGILDVFIGLFTGDWERMGQGLSKIWEGIWSGIGAILVGARDIILNLLTILVTTFSGAWTTFTETIKTMWSDMWTGLGLLVSNAWSNLTESFDDLKKNIAGWFADLAKSAIDWGKNLIAGFIDGIKSAIGGIGDAVKSVGDFFSGGSSSGVADFRQAEAALYANNKSAIDKISREEGVDLSVAKEMYKTQINQNITINSPKALSPSETARENQKASQKLALQF
ncbi:MAG: phage tail tape measure protein [Firmicutes bacterium HGW-Firmicutes-2]|jgi:TP901 family phage tail tape measure protein|nr:MAG: phage tail tape measure protein [Firmicutes bacterium HGW-Firmicutes-2]